MCSFSRKLLVVTGHGEGLGVGGEEDALLDGSGEGRRHDGADDRVSGEGIHIGLGLEETVVGADEEK